MSGVYIHIPFCHHKCTYCNFYFSVNKTSLNSVLNAILKEMAERQNYLTSKKIETIYFGGGTPSVLSVKDWEHVFQQLSHLYEWDEKTEITVECNPEDVSLEYLIHLKKLGVTRISLGVQSFNDKVLEWMGRKHSARQSLKSIELIQESGITNFSVDIIFGIPGYSQNKLKKDIEKALKQFYIPHISAYQLTIEPKTKLNYWTKTKKFIPAVDDKMVEEFLILQEIFMNKKYIHYEVSNYARDGYISKHNSAYWLQKPYIGIGPSAHSYNGKKRRWNVSNNYIYSKKIIDGALYYEEEELTIHQKYNEYLYTRLRTMWGCDMDEIEQAFGKQFKDYFLKGYEKFKDYFEINNNIFTLSPIKGFLLADKISLELFYV